MTRRTKKHTKRHRRRRGGGIVDSIKGFFGYAPAPTAPILPAVAAAPLDASVAAEKVADKAGVGSDAQADALGLPREAPSASAVLGTGGRRRRRKTRRRR